MVFSLWLSYFSHSQVLMLSETQRLLHKLQNKPGGQFGYDITLYLSLRQGQRLRCFSTSPVHIEWSGMLQWQKTLLSGLPAHLARQMLCNFSIEITGALGCIDSMSREQKLECKLSNLFLVFFS